jgi:hypothetical protein
MIVTTSVISELSACQVLEIKQSDDQHVCQISTDFTVTSAVSYIKKRKKRKEKFMLFSDHKGSLPRRQPGAMIIGHSPKGKEKPKPKVDPACSVCVCLSSPFLVLF